MSELDKTIQELKPLFERYDVNRSGTIETEEFQRAAQEWTEGRLSTEELLRLNKAWLNQAVLAWWDIEEPKEEQDEFRKLMEELKQRAEAEKRIARILPWPLPELPEEPADKEPEPVQIVPPEEPKEKDEFSKLMEEPEEPADKEPEPVPMPEPDLKPGFDIKFVTRMAYDDFFYEEIHEDLPPRESIGTRYILLPGGEEIPYIEAWQAKKLTNLIGELSKNIPQDRRDILLYYIALKSVEEDIKGITEVSDWAYSKIYSWYGFSWAEFREAKKFVQKMIAGFYDPDIKHEVEEKLLKAPNAGAIHAYLWLTGVLPFVEEPPWSERAAVEYAKSGYKKEKTEPPEISEEQKEISEQKTILIGEDVLKSIEEMPEWEREHVKQLVREYGLENVEKIYGVEKTHGILNYERIAEEMKKAEEVAKREEEQKQSRFAGMSKEELERWIRKQIAGEGKSPEEVAKMLAEEGINVGLTKITFGGRGEEKEEGKRELPSFLQITIPEPLAAVGESINKAVSGVKGFFEPVFEPVIKASVGAVEKTVIEPIRQFLQKDIESRYGNDLTKLEYLQYEAGRKSIGDALQVYTSPIAEVATRFEAKGNPLAAGFFGFVEGGATMLATPAVIGEQIVEKTKEKGILGTAEAVKDMVVGTVEWVAGIPGRVASGRPSEIGRVAGEVAAGAVAGKVMDAPLKTVGKAAEAWKFRGAEHIPLERITQPEVVRGEAQFPFVREIVEKGGEKTWGERATPETTVETTIRQFYETPAKDVTEVGRASPAAMWHATSDVAPFKKESYTVRGAEKRSRDASGQYGAPELSPHFLRITARYETFNPITAIKSAIETVKEQGVTELIKSEIRETFGLPEKAGILHIGLEGVKRVPEEFRGSLESMKEFFREGVEKGIAEKGYAYIEPKTELYRITGEVQAVIPHGAVIERFPGKKYYTVVEGKKVPIYQFIYKGERITEIAKETGRVGEKLKEPTREISELKEPTREISELKEPVKSGEGREKLTIEEASLKYGYTTPYKRFAYRPLYSTYHPPHYDILSDISKSLPKGKEIRIEYPEDLYSEIKYRGKEPRLEYRGKEFRPEYRGKEPQLYTKYEVYEPHKPRKGLPKGKDETRYELPSIEDPEDLYREIKYRWKIPRYTGEYKPYEPPYPERPKINYKWPKINYERPPPGEYKPHEPSYEYKYGLDIVYGSDVTYTSGRYRTAAKKYEYPVFGKIDLHAFEPNIDLMKTFKKNPVGELLFGKLRL